MHFSQEMDVMNTLLAEIVRSLKELQLGFAGELTMSDAMEGLMDALYLDKVRMVSVLCTHEVYILVDATAASISWTLQEPFN